MTPQFKSIKVALVLLFSVVTATGLYAQVGIGTTTPQAALDLDSSSSGFLPPRIALTGTNDSTTVKNPNRGPIVAGTLIYNKSNTNDVTPGYYYWEGTSWNKLASQSSVPSPPSGTNFQITTAVKTETTGSNRPSLARIFGNYEVLSFAPGAMQEVFFTIEMPPNWVAGTDIYPNLNIMPLGAAAADKTTLFLLDYVWANPNEAFDTNPKTTLKSKVSVEDNQYRNIRASFGPISGKNKTPNSILLCRIYRDKSENQSDDTYEGSVGGLSVTVDITTH